MLICATSNFSYCIVKFYFIASRKTSFDAVLLYGIPKSNDSGISNETKKKRPYRMTMNLKMGNKLLKYSLQTRKAYFENEFLEYRFWTLTYTDRAIWIIALFSQCIFLYIHLQIYTEPLLLADYYWRKNGVL